LPFGVLPICSIAAVMLTITGCQDDFGTGGTGELVIPRHQLEQVAPLDLRNSIATTLPTTAPSTQPATQPVAEVTLSIEDCRRLALQNNLDLKVQLYAPAIARNDLTEAEAQFEAVFTTSVNAATSRNPTTPGQSTARTDEITPVPGLAIPLRTGGSINLQFPLDYVHTHAPGPFDTIWNNDPSISISQPLLRGAGLYVNTQGIRISFYELQRSQALTKLEVIRVLADVDRAYWQLFAARETLKVRKREYDLSVAQLERARHQAAVGLIAEVDVVRARSGVADNVENIIVAQNAVRQSERDLKRILNDPTLPLDVLQTVIVPGTAPAAFPYDLDPQRLTQAALRQRMEMLQLELSIAEQTANVRVARNDMLPLLSLQYVYSSAGLGTSTSQAVSLAWERNADSQRLGFQLEVPIGNEAARSRLRRAMLARMQALASKEQQALQIRQEIANAVDTLNTNWQRIVAARERVVLAARTLEVEIRSYSQQLRTSTEVLDAQIRLADAQLSEVSALADYQIAQVDIAFATGTVLGASHVDWQPASQPNVPRY
jgi:outer membrane protein TolC